VVFISSATPKTNWERINNGRQRDEGKTCRKAKVVRVGRMRRN